MVTGAKKQASIFVLQDSGRGSRELPFMFRHAMILQADYRRGRAWIHGYFQSYPKVAPHHS